MSRDGIFPFPSKEDAVEVDILPGPEEDNFFCINYASHEDGFDALLFLAKYNLKFSMTPVTNGTGVIVVHPGGCRDCGNVDCNGGNDEFRLAEMAFQMNYRQIGSMACSVCEKAGMQICGHLIFGSKIKPLF